MNNYPEWVEERFEDNIPDWAEDRWGDNESSDKDNEEDDDYVI
jgi:hypothetical protein